MKDCLGRHVFWNTAEGTLSVTCALLAGTTARRLARGTADAVTVSVPGRHHSLRYRGRGGPSFSQNVKIS